MLLFRRTKSFLKAGILNIYSFAVQRTSWKRLTKRFFFDFKRLPEMEQPLTCGLASVGADVLFLVFCSLVIFCSGLKILLSTIVVIFIFGNFIGLTFGLKNINSPTDAKPKTLCAMQIDTHYYATSYFYSDHHIIFLY